MREKWHFPRRHPQPYHQEPKQKSAYAFGKIVAPECNVKRVRKHKKIVQHRNVKLVRECWRNKYIYLYIALRARMKAMSVA